MRAKFTVVIQPTKDATYPSSDDIRSWLRSLGYESAAVTDTHDPSALYTQLADEIFRDMPDASRDRTQETDSPRPASGTFYDSANERNFVIFFGVLTARNQLVKLLVTRPNGCDLVFRVLHSNLPILQSATERLIRLIETFRSVPPAAEDTTLRDFFSRRRRGNHILDRAVAIFEKHQANLVLSGKVIENYAKETLECNKKDAWVFGVCMLFLVVYLFAYATRSWLTEYSGLGATLDELSRFVAPLLALCIVSLVGVVITYRRIKQSKIISWNRPTED